MFDRVESILSGIGNKLMYLYNTIEGSSGVYPSTGYIIYDFDKLVNGNKNIQARKMEQVTHEEVLEALETLLEELNYSENNSRGMVVFFRISQDFAEEMLLYLYHNRPTEQEAMKTITDRILEALKHRAV